MSAYHHLSQGLTVSDATQTNLAQEAHAFDCQIDERLAHGHIPDLRLSTPCDWFYNNPWRRPEYVRLDFGEQFELIRDGIAAHARNVNGRPKVLEVGCGPGYLSLEMARAGFDVTGLDLSPRCVEVAESFAAADPFKAERGCLHYLAGDFFTEDRLPDRGFDAIVFLGALHHFPDQATTLDRARALLKPEGILIAHEPVRDRVTQGNAVFVHLLRVLLSAQGGFYKSQGIPVDGNAREQQFKELFAEMRYETEAGEHVQSVNDNEAGYEQMRPALEARFETLEFRWRYAFFHEMIGGLRFDEATNVALAEYLRAVDSELCRLGVLSATEFFFIGRNRLEAVDD